MDEAIQEHWLIKPEMPENYEDLMSEKTVIMISSSWFDQWANYSESGENRPGEIDNSNLLFEQNCDQIKLRNDLQYEDDYIFIPESVWTKFHNWYFGGPKIELFVINGEPDLSPIYVNIHMERLQMEPHRLLVSTQISVEELMDFIRQEVLLNDSGEYDLRYSPNQHITKNLDIFMNSSLEDAGIRSEGDLILLERDTPGTGLENFRRNHAIFIGDATAFYDDNASSEDETLQAVLRASMVDTNHNTTSTSTGPSEEREDIELHDMRPIDVLRHDYDVHHDHDFDPRTDYDIQAKRIDEVMNGKRIPLHIRPIGRIRKEVEILLQKSLTGDLES